MIAIGTSKTNFYDQPLKDSGRGVFHHLGIETDDLEALIRYMKARDFEFKKKIKSLGVLKYIMAEGPDHMLLELFEVVKEKISKDQYSMILSLSSE